MSKHIALGVSPDGAALVIKPIFESGRSLTPVILMRHDVEAAGFARASILIGHIMIEAIGAFYPEVDRYQLVQSLAPFVNPLVSPLAAQYHNGDTRERRMGLGVRGGVADLVLVAGSYDGNTVISEDDTQSARRLAELGSGAAPSIIGDLMLRKLAAMHQDILWAMAPSSRG